MKIVLAHRSAQDDSQKHIMPNGLYYLGALLLEKEFDVTLKNYSGYSDEQIIKDLDELKPNIVGMSCYTFNAYEIFKLCRLLKSYDDNIKTVLGGPHASFLSKEILEKQPEVDLIIRGESELAFLALMDKVRSKLPISSLGSITFRVDDEIIENPERKPLDDLDSLPIPAYHYSYQRIISSRGCPGQCIFCSTPQIWGNNVRFRSAHNVVREIQLLNQNYGISYFIFSDDTFTMDKNRTIEICKGILQKGLKITWDCRSRVNFIDMEQLQWMKKAGCISISYGIESGSEKILRNIKKNINIDQIKKATEMTKKLGIQTTFFIIVGSPGEDDSTIDETIKLLKETKPHNIHVSIMNLTPDIELAQDIPLDTWFNKLNGPVYYTNEADIEKLREWADKIHSEFQKDKVSFSLDELTDMIKADPEDFLSFNNLGLLYLSKKMIEDAFICFVKALKINPGFAHAYNNLGVALLMAGNKEKAKEAFLDAVKRNPEDELARENLGNLKGF